MDEKASAQAGGLALEAVMGLRAPALKQTFAVFGHFYDRRFGDAVIPCRELLEIVDRRDVPYDFQELAGKTPELLVVMMNPGSSKPQDRGYVPRVLDDNAQIVDGRDVVVAIPDNAQYQIMRVMLLRGFRHARILNLSDIRSGNSQAFMKLWPQLTVDHSIFAPDRRAALEALAGAPERVLLAWSQDATLLPLARRAQEALRHHETVGVPRGDGLYAYPSPMLQRDKEAWLTAIAKARWG